MHMEENKGGNSYGERWEKISVILAIYNERENIGDLIYEIYSIANPLKNVIYSQFLFYTSISILSYTPKHDILSNSCLRKNYYITED